MSAYSLSLFNGRLLSFQVDIDDSAGGGSKESSQLCDGSTLFGDHLYSFTCSKRTASISTSCNEQCRNVAQSGVHVHAEVQSDAVLAIPVSIF